MSRPRRPLPPHISPGPHHIGDSELRGISPKRLRAPDVGRPFRGVRVIGGDATSLPSRCRALAPLMRPGDFFSHVTAAQLWGFPLPARVERDPRLHLSCVDGRRMRRAAIAAHREVAGRSRVVRPIGIPLSDPASTWLALGPILRLDELVAAGDFVLSGRVSDGDHRRPLATGVELQDAVRSRAGCRGSRALTAALPLVRERVDSPMETALRLAVTGAGLPEPVVNQEAYSASGMYLGKPDLSYPWLKISLEYEGEGHASPEQFRRDLQRYARFRADGWLVFQVTKLDLHRGRAELIERLRAAYIERMREFGFSARR